VLKEAGEKVSKGEVILRLENKNIGLDMEKAQYSQESAQLELDNLREQLEQLKEDLEALNTDSLIQSPIDGVISNLAIEAGDQIKAGTVTAVVSNSSELVVPVQIDELDISKVKEGQSAEITLDALEGKTFTGTVDKVAVEGTNENGIGSFEVIIRIPDPKEIKPGMSANVEILVSEKTDTLILPIEAVQKTDGEYMVMRKSDSEAAEGQRGRISNRQDMVPVKLGLVSDSYVEIVEGLSEGDEVLITGQEQTTNQMFPGMGRSQRFQRPEDDSQTRESTPPDGR
jgi:HlyD family secretion protein